MTGRRVLAATTISAGGAVALLALGVAAATVLVARTVVTPASKRPDDTRVLGVEPGRVRLSRTADSVVPGRYSFWFTREQGHLKLGDIVAQDASSVTREVLSVDVGELDTAVRGRFAGWFYRGPDELGLPFTEVAVQTEFGPAPAWLVPAADGGGPDLAGTASERWIVQVHGRGVRRQEGLRAVPVAHAAGWTSLVVSYRNDGDAPGSTDHRYGLGLTEWRDVDAALAYAVDHGAREIVLMGWSMGGAIVLQTVTRSRFAPLVTGLVLESPVVDWVEVLDFQADALRLPRPVRRAVLALLGASWGTRVVGQSAPIDFGLLDFVRRASDLQVPILLLHSDDDGLVPAGASYALAAARPDLVTFVPFTVARHTKLWNYDPDRWSAAITGFLNGLPGMPGRG